MWVRPTNSMKNGYETLFTTICKIHKNAVYIKKCKIIFCIPDLLTIIQTCSLSLYYLDCSEITCKWI